MDLEDLVEDQKFPDHRPAWALVCPVFQASVSSPCPSRRLLSSSTLSFRLEIFFSTYNVFISLIFESWRKLITIRMINIDQANIKTPKQTSAYMLKYNETFLHVGC